MKNSVIKADFFLLTVSFIWGSTFVLVQNAIQDLPPFSFNTIRFFLATLTMLFVMKLVRGHVPITWSNKTIFYGIILGIMLHLGYTTQTIALLYSTSSKVGFITGLNVVFVPIIAFFFMKQRPERYTILGIIIAVVGLYFLTLADSFTIGQGDFLAFICAICFAAHIVFTGKYAPFHSIFVLTIVQLITVTILSLISSLGTESIDYAILTNSSVWIALVITAVFATALAFFLQTHFQKQTKPTHVALIFATEPVFAALFGMLFNHEVLTGKAIIGCFFIFIGMILAELPLSAIMQFFQQKRRKTT